MKHFFVLLFIATSLLNAESNRASIVFKHVAVVDTATATIQQDMAVVITDNHISDMGKVAEVKVPESARVIDGAGRYLIPGLWDMHVHIFSGGRFPGAVPLLIANGVTGVREMGTYVPLGTINGIRQQITDGKLIGPRIVAAGPVVDGRFKDWTNLNVTTASEATQAVRFLKEQGADFIKVYDSLSRTAYFAIADESRKQGIPFVGHVPYDISAREAATAGQKSIEHLTGILAACSSRESEIRRGYSRAWEEPDFSLAAVEGMRADVRAADTYSSELCTELAHLFRARGTWQCPTLVSQRNATYDPSFLASDSRLKYIPDTWRSQWLPENDIFAKGYTSADRQAFVRLYDRWVELAGLLQRSGVDFLAGTDLGVSFIYPGFSLHDELALLVQVGLTPGEALKTATYNPAKFLVMLDRLGTVEKGKLADLVLLDANPLEDIHNTQTIRAVVLNGRYLDRAALDKLLADAASDAPVH
jgi:imidazolonepropionase-like amidohydrolase